MTASPDYIAAFYATVLGCYLAIKLRAWLGTGW